MRYFISRSLDFNYFPIFEFLTLYRKINFEILTDLIETKKIKNVVSNTLIIIIIIANITNQTINSQRLNYLLNFFF